MNEAAALRSLEAGLARLFYAESGSQSDARYELTPTQKKCLSGLLSHAPRTDVELASRCGIARSQLSRAIKSLIAVDLVRFLPSREHKAQRHLFLSKTGRIEAEIITGNRDARIVAFLEQLDSSEREVIQRLPRKLRALPTDKVPATAIDLRPATFGDLIWLLRGGASQADRVSVLKAPYLLEQLKDLTSLVAQDPEEQAWIADAYGAPLGGCALLLTKDDDGNLIDGQIILLHLAAPDHAAEIAERLIRTCVEKAEALTLVHLRIKHDDPQTYLKEALSRTGFKVETREREANFAGVRRETWSRFLTPIEEA